MPRDKAAVLAELRNAIANTHSETSARNAVTRVLMKYGNVGVPQVVQGRMDGGGTVRVYVWERSPAGGFGLITGPSVEDEILTLDELSGKGMPEGGTGIYIELQPADARYSTAVRETVEAIRARGRSKSGGQRAPKSRGATQTSMGLRGTGPLLAGSAAPPPTLADAVRGTDLRDRSDWHGARPTSRSSRLPGGGFQQEYGRATGGRGPQNDVAEVYQSPRFDKGMEHASRDVHRRAPIRERLPTKHDDRLALGYERLPAQPGEHFEPVHRPAPTPPPAPAVNMDAAMAQMQAFMAMLDKG